MYYSFVVDFSYNPLEEVSGIGIVVHSSSDRKKSEPIIDEIAETYSGVSADHGEAFAILRALEIASDFDAEGVKIWSDYNQLRRAIKKDLENGTCSRRSQYYEEIIDCASMIKGLSIRYVPRRKNHAAHRLSRIGSRIVKAKKLPGSQSGTGGGCAANASSWG
ncbi:MAG: ribonuclease HI [Pseudoalteromonas tetraodonis]|jgi:ribonuclease HI